MINSKPNGKGNYIQGNYKPQNLDKVLKLNAEFGIYFRSSWERMVCIYLDNNPSVVKWGCEIVEIPYQLKIPDKHGMVKITKHRYYPDFYYTLQMDDGSRKTILLEVKPMKQVMKPKMREVARLTSKQLKNYEYDIKEYNRNLSKWAAAIEYCNMKGHEFKILTEEQIGRIMNIRK